jgi:glycosyltransferase involved in cell wall biosynthesis
MNVSVIIATYNRATELGECLDALARQPFASTDEVVVVDNGSTDATAHVIADMAAGFPVPLHHVFEPVPGKCHALARALDRARGEVLAFIDDDVIVDDRWFDSLRHSFGDPDLMLMAGRVDPRWACPPPAWLRWRDEDGTLLPMTAPLAILHYGAEQDLGARTAIGANMAIRRAALDAVGGFPIHLGKLRGTLLSGEDHDVCQRIAARGMKARYVPAVRVGHLVPASRMCLRYYLRWYFWSGITNAALESASAPSRYWIERAVVETLHSVANAIVLRASRSVDHATRAAFAVGFLARRWRVIALPNVEDAEAVPA